MNDAPPRRHPRNPLIGFVFAMSFLVSAVLGSIALVFAFGTLGDVGSHRVAGFLIAGPFAFAGAGIATAVRAAHAWGPWRRYRAMTPVQQRRRDRAHDLPARWPWPLLVAGILALAGQMALILSADHGTVSSSVTGVLLFIEVNILLFTIWAACTGTLVRFLAARHPRFAPRSEQPLPTRNE